MATSKNTGKRNTKSKQTKKATTKDNKNNTQSQQDFLRDEIIILSSLAICIFSIYCTDFIVCRYCICSIE